MRTRRGIVRFSVIGLLVVWTAYFSAYLMFVEREPVYYGGNKLRQISLAVWQANTATIGPQLPAPSAPPSPPPDSYRPVYPSAGAWAATFFAPAQWVDSCLRPSYWPPYEPRRFAC
jgi:hypothetical protein